MREIVGSLCVLRVSGMDNLCSERDSDLLYTS